ncbi:MULTISPECIES: cytochrome c [Rhodopseudomonas]|uniref:Cytochrome C n=1 Tax=Rhodopseudomonas palustris TaxID=1076 RepID=A0A0D7EFJ8_RHOPL|nr:MULTISPECIES: cytochrome c [Rhodopseudomonas]KIZ39589.1 cytochrome C [Rhodopseudomonas palustris]MDF3813842.1 cytochrome c [Rhodopseudomonas sp. BAL398]WOK15434.1 cytochrome c [Rhodopseudomonas sp. BAL398]
MRRIPVLLAIQVLMISSAVAASSAQLRGKAYVEAHCARCHAVGRSGDSPLTEAPPFRTLHKRYPIETLAEAFAEGISTGHNDMPAFELEPDQINDLLAYLKGLE